MRVLVACPAKRDMLYRRSYESVLNLSWQMGTQIDVMFLVDGDFGRRWENLCHKLNDARRQFLAGPWDAMLTVESDIVVPPNALELMAGVGAQVVYGLFVLRFGSREWNVALEMNPETRTLTLLSENMNEARTYWQSVMPCVGHGQGICLIHRAVLEEVAFRTPRPLEHAQDWYFSQDCQALGISQAADLRVVCGHIEPNGSIYWPDPEHKYVIEE
jgi:hypothetical protein